MATISGGTDRPPLPVTSCEFSDRPDIPRRHTTTQTDRTGVRASWAALQEEGPVEGVGRSVGPHGDRHPPASGRIIPHMVTQPSPMCLFPPESPRGGGGGRRTHVAVRRSYFWRSAGSARTRNASLTRISRRWASGEVSSSPRGPGSDRPERRLLWVSGMGGPGGNMADNPGPCVCVV